MEKKQKKAHVVEKLIKNFIGHSQTHGNLLKKYTDTFFLNYFDRLKIDQTVKKIESHQKQLGMPQFVRLFLSIINHTQQETLYLAISLVRLYKTIKEDTNNQKGVKFADFTNFLCNKISEADPDLVVPMKEIPLEKVIPDTLKIREIDINPPPILSKIQLQRPKIIKNKNKKDRKMDEKKNVAKFIFSPSLNLIIALGRLSSSISLYQPYELKKTLKILPSACKLMAKDVAILSLAYCQREKRIGCIINNIGIVFWEASDNFTTEKILGSSKSDNDPKAYGNKIYFFCLFNEWATTDKNTIYFWDIKEEVISKSIKKEQMSAINDICEVKHIRCLLVSYTSQITKQNPEQKKLLVLYHKQKQVSKLYLQNSGCHTLMYNQSTQLIVLLGYSNVARVLQIDIKTFDINVVTELKAHNSILTCVCNIPNTAMIITGDDLGYVKLWDLNYMRCLQGEKIAKVLHQIVCYKNQLFYADSRINVIQMEHSAHPNSQHSLKTTTSQSIDEEIYGIYQFFRKQEQKLWVITRKQAREICLKDGRQVNIYLLCNSQEEVSAAAELFNGFVVGTSKGQLSKYSLDGEKKWKIVAHQSQINCIKVDFENHLIGTIGRDNNLIIWSQKSILDKENGVRKKISFANKDINLLQLSPYANILAVGSTTDKVLQIWNYDTVKLLKKIEMNSFISSFKILADKFLIIVTTMGGQLCVLSYGRKQNKPYVECIYLMQVCWIDPSNESEKSMSSSYFSLIEYCEDLNMLVAGTPQGWMYGFKFGVWPTNQNYRREYEPTPAIRRFTRESYEHQILKNKFTQNKMIDIMVDREFSLPKMWTTKIHKDNLLNISILNLQKKYLSSLCLDGYCKLSEINSESCNISGSLKLNYPLPIKWNLQVQDYCDLKGNLHEALAVIDSILKNYGYDLSISEQINLNITHFLEGLFESSYEIQKTKGHPQIMSSEFTQFDVNGQLTEKTMSLKSLEAYKRLQMIKKQHQYTLEEDKKIEPQKYQTTSIQKQSIRQFLSPTYLPKILNTSFDEDSEKKNDLVKRIQMGFQAKENRKNKQAQKIERELKCLTSFSKGHETIVSLNKSILNRSMDRIRQKSIRQILGQINSKLSDYKKNKGKVFKAQA